MKVLNNQTLTEDLPEQERTINLSSEDNTFLQNHGIYYLLGDLEPIQATSLHQSILRKNLDPSWPSLAPLTIVINSPGGELVGATWPLVDIILASRFPIRTVAIGDCSSGAALVLSCGTKGLRAAMPNASIMFHQLSSATEGNVEGIRSWYGSVEQEHRKMVRLLAKTSKYKSLKVVEKQLLAGEDVWLSPERALEHGLIDKIISRGLKW